MLARSAPDQLIVAKHGAGAVVIGLGEGETYVASDIPALLPHTRDVVLPRGRRDGGRDAGRAPRSRRSTAARCSVAPTRIDWDASMAEKGGYRHFMLKEIYEQPRAVADTIRGRVMADEAVTHPRGAPGSGACAARIRRVVFVACGTRTTPRWSAGP